MMEEKMVSATEQFAKVLQGQLERIQRMKEQGDFVDYSGLDQIVIGVCGGDGIGPRITHEAQRVISYLLQDQVKAGRVVFKEIDGLTIENRVAQNKAIPDDVLAELKACHVILKGPTTTPARATPGPTSKAPTWPCAKSSTSLPTSVR